MALTCFIATAFDHDDVDTVFLQAIKPVLRGLGIRANRVDRVEHNDDIDDKIFELMNSSQFCIADLTYARPSVYFEAGFMAGTGKPVIYTCRSDHFRPLESDRLGNLRVHFDLQMKNIIPWTSPDARFMARLRSRTRLVTKPMRDTEALREARNQERKDFAALSPVKRHAELVRLTVQHPDCRMFNPSAGVHRSLQFKDVVGLRLVNGKPQALLVFPSPTFTRKGLQEVRQFLQYNFLPGSLQNLKTGSPMPTVVHFVLASMAPLPPSRLAAVFPEFEFSREHGCLSARVHARFVGDVFANIAVIQPVLSPTEYSQALGTALRSLEALGERQSEGA